MPMRIKKYLYKFKELIIYILGRAATRLYIFLKAPYIYSNYWQFLTNHFVRINYILSLRNGLKFYIKPEPGATTTITEMFLFKPYIQDEFFIKPDDTVLDVGANIGAFTIYAAQLLKNGRIYAFEPVKENFELLSANVKLNKFNNVRLFNSALDSAKGTRDIYLSGSSSGFIIDRKSKKTEKISTLTLEDVLSDNHIDSVDFLKMDCEGAEYDILLNAKKETLSRIKKIVLEYHNISDAQNITILDNHLRTNNFRTVIKKGEWNGILFAKLRERNTYPSSS